MSYWKTLSLISIIAICNLTASKVESTDSGKSGEPNPAQPHCGVPVLNVAGGGELVSHKLYLQCPFPGQLPCQWDLHANLLDIHSRLEFTFTAYEMPREAEPCTNNHVSFLDGNSESAFMSACSGRDIPLAFNSTSNRIKVKVLLQGERSVARGFVFKWRRFRECQPGDFHCASGDCIDPRYHCDNVTNTTELVDCSDGSDEASCPELTCNSTTQFRCTHKLRCIDLDTQRCNGVNDCRDNSDEEGCAVCPSDASLCRDKVSCFQSSFLCDATEDCTDGSDEANCPEVTCNKATQFRCAHKRRCIDLATQRCNGVNDCRDNSDEEGCAVCKPDEGLCFDKASCFKNSHRCDGTNDCVHGTDEAGCPVLTCNSTTQFRCAHKLRCIDLATQRCDGKNDCRDNSDEEGCAVCKPGEELCFDKVACFIRCNGKNECSDGSDEAECKVALCKPNERHCAHTFACYDNNKRCDAIRDCNDGSDEAGCIVKTCGRGEQSCRHRFACFKDRQRCDGTKNCNDGSDEVGCPNCPPLETFHCATRLHCVSRLLRCDRKPDCPDGSDEHGCPRYGKYLGCYKDQRDWPDLRHKHEWKLNLPDLSIQFCEEFCMSFLHSARYAVQGGKHCICGWREGRYGKAPLSDCHMPCTGAKDFYCGGKYRNDIYMIMWDREADSKYRKKYGWGPLVPPDEHIHHIDY